MRFGRRYGTIYWLYPVVRRVAPGVFFGGSMGIFELFLLALGLSMDAFAVSICKGLATETLRPRHMVIVGLWFGGFQALMPLLGYFLGASFQRYITAVDHWVAFVLLVLIGGNMIRESFSCEAEHADGSLSPAVMAPMAVATSIDALAVGITFALLPDVQIVPAVSFIGVITFLLSALGVKVGNVFGARYKSKAEFLGGAILVLLGLKILLEHLGILG